MAHSMELNKMGLQEMSLEEMNLTEGGQWVRKIVQIIVEGVVYDVIKWVFEPGPSPGPHGPVPTCDNV